MGLVWLPSALTARRAAIDYIAREDPKAALSQLNQIKRQTALLKEHPELGRFGRVPGTRELVIGRAPFIVVYRVRGEHVQILNLLHGAQRWP